MVYSYGPCAHYGGVFWSTRDNLERSSTDSAQSAIRPTAAPHDRGAFSTAATVRRPFGTTRSAVGDCGKSQGTSTSLGLGII